MLTTHDLNATNKTYGWTLLHFASHYAIPRVTKLLLRDSRIRVDVLDKNNNTALSVAMSRHQDTLVKVSYLSKPLLSSLYKMYFDIVSLSLSLSFPLNIFTERVLSLLHMYILSALIDSRV